MRRRSALVIVLTAPERAELARWPRRPGLPWLQVRAGQIVLRVAQGEPLAVVARALGLSRKHVYGWLRRWQAQGVAGLVPKKRGPAPAHEGGPGGGGA